MSYNIVTVNVSQTIGATPANLQQMSAILSFGATSQEPGKPVLITKPDELNDLIQLPIASLGATKDADSTDFIMKVGGTAALNREAGSTVEIEIINCTPSVWNGIFTATVTDTTTLTWSLAAYPAEGSPTTLGQFTLEGSDDLSTAVEDFFAQGNKIGTYVLELGYFAGVPKDEVAALKAYIQDPLLQFYSYLVPATWDSDPDFIALSKLYTANEAKQYFFIPTKNPQDTNYISPYAGIKSVAAVADDTFPETNAAAAAMWNYVSSSPSETNKVPPMAFRFLRAVNANKAKANILATMAKQNINYVDTGAEGGISNTILVKGVFGDGNDMTYWYSVDWVQINVDRMLANAVINGSNNPINPLYYNQDGIDRLQQVTQGVFNSGVSFGLVNGQTPVNAVPFKTYVKNNPNDYGIGRYAGLSATYTPMRGFVEIIFNINVTMQLS